jgi:hypothetical protein
MDLATIKTGIESWLNITAVDVDDSDTPLPVQFARAPKVIYTRPHVKVELGPIQTRGWDIPRYTYNALTDEYVEQMRGLRRLPLRVKFVAFDQEWGKNARQYAEDFRVRLRKQSSIEALRDALLAFQESTDLVDSDATLSGRLVSMVDLTVYLGLCGYERNPSDDVGYIKNVNIEGQGQVIDEMSQPIDDESGNPVVVEDTITINVVTE